MPRACRAPRAVPPTRRLVPTLLSLLVLSACGGGRAAAGSEGEANRMRDAGTAGSATGGATGGAPSERAAGEWESLFDGTTLAGWHGFKTPGKVPAGWRAIDGTLVRVADAGDLVTDRTFADFELTLDWQVGPAGNSGIFYRLDPTTDVTYHSAPEMQVLDDAGHPDGRSRLTAAGSVYGLYPAPDGVVKPAGQWNSARLVVRGAQVEHWLNGTMTARYELGSADWEARVKDSKFAAWPGYGRARRGFIGLQDHGDRVAYRNIRIRELP